MSAEVVPAWKEALLRARQQREQEAARSVSPAPCTPTRMLRTAATTAGVRVGCTEYVG